MSYFTKNPSSLFKWNSKDLNQFNSPILFGGASNVTASIITDPYGSNSKVIRLGLPSGTIGGGGAIIPVTKKIPFQSMKMKFISQFDTGVGFGITGSNSLVVGLVFAASTSIGTSFNFFNVMSNVGPSESVGFSISNGYSGSGYNVFVIDSPGFSYVRMNELSFNGITTQTTSSWYAPAIIGELKTIPFNGFLTSSLVGANFVTPSYSSSWASSSLDTVGIFIATTGNLTSGSSVLLSTISFEKYDW